MRAGSVVGTLVPTLTLYLLRLCSQVPARARPCPVLTVAILTLAARMAHLLGATRAYPRPWFLQRHVQYGA